MSTAPVPRFERADAAFFAEWNRRAPGERRSLRRAAALLDRLGVRSTAPVLTVVGSKGKGTTTTFASAYLAAAGQRTVSVTSPSFLSPAERLRVDGVAITPDWLAALGRRLADHLVELPPPAGFGGYTSPSGLFTIAGLLLATEVEADFVVLEAGRGGRSDEVSLIDPTVVAISPIFAEHVDELGGSVATVVADKCGVITDATKAVVTGAQDPSTLALIERAVSARTADRLSIDRVDPATAMSTSAPAELRPPRLGANSTLLPPGLGAGNALLGCRAAQRMLDHTNGRPPAESALASVLRSVRLPGRLSLHPLDGGEVLVDAAVSAAGFTAALAHANRRWGGVDRVLLSLPDDKDIAGAASVLADLPVTFVPLRAPHLRYDAVTPAAWNRIPAEHVDRAYVSALGKRILALGTISFVAHLLRIVDADATVAFRSPVPRNPNQH